VDERSPIAEEEPKLFQFLLVFWRGRKTGAKIIAIPVILSIIITLLLPKYYIAETIILPELEKSKLASLGLAADIGALGGIGMGEFSISKIYPVIVRSETILSDVVTRKLATKKDSTNLLAYWGLEGNPEPRTLYEGVEQLRDMLDVSFDSRLATVTIRIEMKDPVLAAEVVNAIAENLDHYMRTKRRTNASMQREFVEGRLSDVGKELERAENMLKEFREKNRRILDSPELMLQEGRLRRNVEVTGAMYLELKKQYEIAKIEEVKNIPIVNVLDTAKPPVKKSRPQRLFTVILTFIISTFVAAGWVTFPAMYPGYAQRMKEILETILPVRRLSRKGKAK